MWKEIPDTDGLYFADEFGNIKSSSRSVKLVSHNKASYYMRAGKILKQPLNSHGYPCVTIKYLNGTQKVVQVHRLIAKTFIPNPDNLPQINHIDGNKCNNSVQNLEWCSVRDNIRHAFKTGLNQGSKPWLGKVGKMHPNSIPVIALNLDGSLYKEYESVNLAAKDVGMCSSSHISACLHGHRKSAGGYIWKFKN